MYSTKGQKAFLKYVIAMVESHILFQPTRDVHQDHRELKETHVLEVSVTLFLPKPPIIMYHRPEKPQNIFAVHQSSLTQTYLFISKTELLDSLYTVIIVSAECKVY